MLLADERPLFAVAADEALQLLPSLVFVPLGMPFMLVNLMQKLFLLLVKRFDTGDSPNQLGPFFLDPIFFGDFIFAHGFLFLVLINFFLASALVTFLKVLNTVHASL